MNVDVDSTVSAKNSGLCEPTKNRDFSTGRNCCFQKKKKISNCPTSAQNN